MCPPRTIGNHEGGLYSVVRLILYAMIETSLIYICNTLCLMGCILPLSFVDIAYRIKVRRDVILWMEPLNPGERKFQSDISVTIPNMAWRFFQRSDNSNLDMQDEYHVCSFESAELCSVTIHISYPRTKKMDSPSYPHLQIPHLTISLRRR